MTRLNDELYAAWVPRELHEELKQVMINNGFGDKKAEFVRYALREIKNNLNRK